MKCKHMTKFQFKIKHDTTYFSISDRKLKNPTSGFKNKEKNIIIHISGFGDTPIRKLLMMIYRT
jgi:hypothetical protein